MSNEIEIVKKKMKNLFSKFFRSWMGLIIVTGFLSDEI